MTSPIDYAKRAGNTPKPADWVEPEERLGTISGVSSSDHEVFADVSEFQSVSNDSYPSRILAVRIDNGFRLDYNIAGNWSWAKSAHTRGRLDMLLCYVVYKPGQNQAILNRVKSFFGGTCPSFVAFEIDMESGADFAGPGNHSAEANQLASLLSTFSGALARQIAYANSYDYASNWPQFNAALKKNTASYGSIDPGTYAQQYYGGMPQYPVPAGLPTSMAPFGAYVDLNVIRKPLATILADFRVGQTPTPTTGSTDMIFVKFINSGRKNNEDAIYQVFGNGLLHMDPSTLIWLGHPPVHVMDLRSVYWNLPVVPGSADYRGK